MFFFLMRGNIFILSDAAKFSLINVSGSLIRKLVTILNMSYKNSVGSQQYFPVDYSDNLKNIYVHLAALG